MLVALGSVIARLDLAAGRAARLLRRSLAGQPHQDRADSAEPRPDPRSQRRCRSPECALLSARAHARAGPDIDATLRALAALGLLDNDGYPEPEEVIRGRRIFEAVPVKLQLTTRSSRASPRVRTNSGRGDPPAPDALLPARCEQRARDRLRRRDQRGGQETRSTWTDYAGTTLTGKSGVERAYEKQLHGRAGFSNCS